MNELTARQQDVYTAMSHMGAKGRDGRWVSAEQVGWHLRGVVPDVRRHGNQAVKGSWSGLVARGFVLAPTMTSLVRRGLAESMRDERRARTVYLYRLTK